MAVKRAPSKKPRPVEGRKPKKNPLFAAKIEYVDYDWTLNDGYFTAAPVWQKIAQTMVVSWHITPDHK